MLYAPTLILDKCRHQVTSFLNTYPQCELELHSTAVGQRAVLDKRFDLMMYIGEPYDSSFIARRLGDMGYDYFASPEYIDKQGQPESPEEISDHRCIYRIRNESDVISWEFGELELMLKPDIVCDSPYMAHALAVQGTGIARLPLLLAATSVARGQLVPLFESSYAIRRNIYGIYSSRRYLPHKVKILMEDIGRNLPTEIARMEQTR